MELIRVTARGALPSTSANKSTSVGAKSLLSLGAAGGAGIMQAHCIVLAVLLALAMLVNAYECVRVRLMSQIGH